MHRPKLLRSICVRSAMVPAVLLCVIASACADEQPTGPKLPPRVVATTNDVAFDKFFIAWSQSYSSGPIRTQMFALDARQERQYVSLWPSDSVLAFARVNPGRLYIDSDEPDQWCIAPSDYADFYHDFVATVRGADPTARFSPAGFAEPNHHCCPSEDVYEPCWSNIHSISYAQDFYNAYLQRYGVAPPVNEWRFHDFGLAFAAGDLDGWWARVDKEATWSVSHGANMVLGAWGFHGWREPVPAFQEHLKQAIGRLMNDKRINGAVWWSYEKWVESPRPLVNDDGTLTAEGQTYANPLTDIPTDVEVVRSEDVHAKLQWSNTTLAWAAEAEFWVQARGSNSFVYHNTELVAGPGGKQTPFVDFNVGDSVKARVRYYNAYGRAAWSPFSNTVFIKPGKGPNFCILQLC